MQASNFFLEKLALQMFSEEGNAFVEQALSVNRNSAYNKTPQGIKDNI